MADEMWNEEAPVGAAAPAPATPPEAEQPRLADHPVLPAPPPLLAPPPRHAHQGAPTRPAPSQARTLDGLRRRFLWNNWSLRSASFPKYMIRDRGSEVETLAERFVEDVNAQAATEAKRTGRRPRLKVGWVWEATNESGVTRPIRIVNRIGWGHKTSADVTLQRQGDNIYVAVNAAAYTRIVILRQMIFILAFLSLFVGGIWLTMRHTGAKQRWINDFAMTYVKSFQAKRNIETGDVTERVGEMGWRIKDLDTLVLARAEDGQLALRIAETMMGHAPLVLRIGDTDAVKAYNGWRAFLLLRTVPGFGARLDAAFDEFLNDPDARGFSRQDLTNADAVEKRLEEDAQIEYLARRDFIKHARITPERVAAARQEVKAVNVLLETYVEPEAARSWNEAGIFLADPKQFMLSVASIPAILAVVCSALLQFTPRSWMRFPCILLGWPTPEYFENQAKGHVGDMMSILSRVQTGMGITKEDIIPMDK